MPKVVKVPEARYVPDGAGASFVTEGRRIAVFNSGGVFHAMDDACSHVGAALSQGGIKDGKVTCPLHGAQFDVVTGAALCPPARRPVKVYPVTVVDGEIHIEI